jgi:hypothetical protein
MVSSRNRDRRTRHRLHGERPVWREIAVVVGAELFYASDAAIMRVPVDTLGSRFAAAAPELLFTGPFDPSYTSYAVSKDGVPSRWLNSIRMPGRRS